MDFSISNGPAGGQAPPDRILVARLDGRVIGSAARLPDDTERWCVVPAGTPERTVHRDERDYSVVLGEPAARAALEHLAAA